MFDDLSLIQKTIDNQKELYSLFQYYLFIVNSMENNNFDDSVSLKFINSLYEQLMNKKIDNNQYFLLPYKNKIKHLYDNKDKTLDNLYNRFSYLIKFDINRNMIRYSICRCLSSENKETFSIENLRFEDIEIINSSNISYNDLQMFLTNLFYYGELN